MTEKYSPTVSGQVLRDGAGHLWIDVPRNSACKSCAKSSRCSMNALDGLVGSSSLRLPIEDVDLDTGDRVTLACPSEGLLKAAFLAYGLPALGLILGAVAMASMHYGDSAQALGSGLGLTLGLMTTRWAVTHGHLPSMTYFKE